MVFGTGRRCGGRLCRAQGRRYRPGIDLVIADHAMPQITGAELAGLIRAGWPALPVVVATGYAELPAGIAAGLAVHVKPYDLRELARTVAEAARCRSNPAA